MEEDCEIRFCRKKRTMNYIGHGLCDECYEKGCNGKIDLKKELKIKC